MRKWLVIAAIFMIFLAFGEQEPLVSNFFQETYILDALADIAAQTGVPIIADTTVSGFVTIELNEVPLEKALKMILMPGGYSFIKVDGFYFVGAPDPKNPAFRYLAQTKAIKPKYLKVDSIKNLIPSFYEPFLKIDTQNNLITITAPEQIIERFEEDLQKIDLPPRQVKISVVVTEVSKDAMSDLGLDQFGYTFGANQQIKEDWTTILGLVSGVLSVQTDVFGTIVARIQALEEQRKATIKADPWIIVQENKPARLFVGQREIIIIQPEEGTATTQTVDVGVGLDITARVVGNNELEIAVAPSVSHFTTAQVSSSLSTKRSELSTTLSIQSGQTVVISGLTVEQSSDSYTGFPFFGNIPILRYLFGVKSDSESKRELVIFLSAEVL
ncbi:type II secretion system protein GspD [Thermotoga profunda]|uniref:type II secretion system protein GspD n=1 Tax=Thermotoga profunda TaxID=1508420 RepID=UPI000596F602|nr:secretin [Thermotoga profunda]